jgi:hypothetical protein
MYLNVFIVCLNVFECILKALKCIHSVVEPKHFYKGTVKVGVPKKVVFTKISTHVSVSNKSIFKIKLSMTSPNVVLPYYTYNTKKFHHN